MKKTLKDNELKIHKLGKNIYQTQKGALGVVIVAKNETEALNKACKYLGIQCNKNAIQAE
ncbi:hypothetical protein [Caminibacter pacificus]|jgi:hypothetical protein